MKYIIIIIKNNLIIKIIILNYIIKKHLYINISFKMDENIIVDAEEKQKRLERLKRFGENDSEYLEKIKKDRSLKLTPDDIILNKPKSSYKINIESEEGKEIVFDKKKLMLFGIELMNTEDIESYFDNINKSIKKIFWLNDFTCLVEFDNELICLEAYSLLTHYEIDKNKSDIENFNWRKSLNYMVKNRELEIEVRIAVEGDVNKKSDKKEGVYYKFYNKKIYNNNYYNNRQYKNYKYKNYNYRNKYRKYNNKNNFKYRERSRSKSKQNENDENKLDNEENKSNDIDNNKLDEENKDNIINEQQNN